MTDLATGSKEPGELAAPVAEISHVTFRYATSRGAQATLDDVSLRIEKNDFLALIGPNGGGKTTLLKILLGLLKAESGSVRVLGQKPRRVRHRIGYVPQHARIDPSVPASALDVVLMGRLARSSWGPRFGSEHVDAALAALARTATADLAARPIATLSGGERQRVLIARALAAETELLILDEPTAGVDLHIEKELIELLVELNEKLPIVLVSHDVSMVSSRLKRVACLNRRLTLHAAHEVSAETIAAAYHGPMAVVDEPLKESLL